MIELLNDWGQAWAAYFGVAVIQNTAFLGLVFLSLQLVRNGPARLKYTIGLIGLIKLLLPPFVPTALLESSPVAVTALPLTSLGFTAVSDPLTSGAMYTTPGFSAVGLLFVFWTGMAVLYLGYTLVSTLHLRLALRNATELFELAPSIDPPRRCRIRLFKSDAIAIPLTVGVFPKRIYVPAAWDRWSEDCREMVYRHESAHVSRHDGLFQVLQIFAQALYFFHPLVWLLNRRLNEYREMACDDASVAGESASRIEYSKTLVEIAETIARDALTCETASALIRRKNELLNRVKYQMKEETMRRVPKTKMVAVTGTFVLLTLLFSWYIGGATPAASPTGAMLAKSKSTGSVRFVDVSIKGEKDIRIHGEPVTLKTFEDKMEALVPGERDNVVVNLDCVDDMPMDVLFDVQKILRKMNLIKVSYKNDLGEALPLALPSEKLEKKIESIPKTDIVDLVVTDSGDVLLDGKKVPVHEINEFVKKRVDENDHLIVSIHVQKETNYRQFVWVLKQAKKGDATRIFINEPGR